MSEESRVPFETQPAALETVPAPLDSRPPREVSLFWRTFFLLAMLLLGCIIAWLQTFRALEFEPRALQSAQQLASLVNLTRAGLIHADSIARVSLVKTLADEEKVRIAPREPGDTYRLYNTDSLSRRISEQVKARLGPDTVVAREVNNTGGLWIGFSIDNDPYWLQTDPSRVELVAGITWLIWLGTAALLSLAGAALIARLINRPLKKLSFAASRVRDGDFSASRLSERVQTSEIRQVNIGFNRMAQTLAKVEQDRAVMLAGISHDLRTPLARMLLAVEILRDAPAQSADGLQPDEASAPYLAHLERDIAQMNQLIGELLVLARGLESEPPQEVNVPDFLAEMATEFALALPSGPSPMPLNVQPCRVHVPPLALRRALGNLLQNAQRYAPAESVSVACEPLSTGCRISVLDRGPGIADEQLPKMLQPFQRLEPSRSPASGGFGLGLAIVNALATANAWQFELSNREGGGLAACLVLPDRLTGELSP